MMISDDKPKRRAPTTGTLVGTRFQANLLNAIDVWRKEQADLPTRPEAVRRLLELGMTRGANYVGPVKHHRHAEPTGQ